MFVRWVDRWPFKVASKLATTVPKRSMPKDSTEEGLEQIKSTESNPATTLTDRVRSLAYGASQGKSKDQEALTAEQDQQLRDKFITELRLGRSTKERVKSLDAATEQIQKYSITTTLAILDAAEDLAGESSSPETRKACFAYLAVAASHQDLDENSRKRLFEIIVLPAAPSCSADQIRALNKLTRFGKDVAFAEPRLSDFLSELLEPLFEATKEARAERARLSKSKKLLNEEFGFASLLTLLKDVLIFNAQLDQDRLALLLRRVILICRQTAKKDDLQSALAVTRAATTDTIVPNVILEPLIHVLCRICHASKIFLSDAQHCLDNIIFSPIEADATTAFLQIFFNRFPEGVEKPYDVQQLHEIRGALLQLEHIYANSKQRRLPMISFETLIKALLAAGAGHQGTEDLCLEVVATVINEENMIGSFLSDDWSPIGRLVANIATDTDTDSDSEPAEGSRVEYLTSASPLRLSLQSREFKKDEFSDRVRLAIGRIGQGLLKFHSRLNLEKKTIVANLVFLLGGVLDSNVIAIAIDFLKEERLLYPPNENWSAHLKIVLNRAYLDASKDRSIRLKVFDLLSEVYYSTDVDKKSRLECIQIFMALALRADIGSDISLVNQLASFVPEIAQDLDMPQFEIAVKYLTHLAVQVHRVDSPVLHTNQHDDPINHAMHCLVRLFLSFLPQQSVKAKKIYEHLLDIAADSKATTYTRLESMKLVSSLRCDSVGLIKALSMPDTQGLAATLLRTEDLSCDRASATMASSRVSVAEEIPKSRSGRNSGIDGIKGRHSRSTTRSTVEERLSPSLWSYANPNTVPQSPIAKPYQNAEGTPSTIKGLGSGGHSSFLNFSSWLTLLISILDHGADWEIYSYVLVHLPSQLTNMSLFVPHISLIESLYDKVVHQLQTSKFHEPPSASGLKRGDVAVCLYHTLSILICYREYFSPHKMAAAVPIFLEGLKLWDRAAKCCIHALALCCHELARSVDKCLPFILSKMSQIISQSYLAMDILEFLARLARLPDAYQSLREEGYRTIFGICISHLHSSREKRQPATDIELPRSSQRHSDFSGQMAIETGHAGEAKTELPEYVYALAYHVITHWFLAIPIEERSKHVGWIAKNLAWKDKLGKEILEEQSQVTLDMMHRTAYLDLGETMLTPVNEAAEGALIKKSWLIGMSIMTIETDAQSGLTRITKRQASGTTHAVYSPHTAPLPPHHVETRRWAHRSTGAPLNIYPHHVLLQLSSTISPMPIPTQPIVLPEDEQSKRAIRTIDRIDTVDGHKAGVVYIAVGQTEEQEILANTAGSEVFDSFLEGLGTKVVLKEANFNTQGLDREYDVDGTHTYAWRDRVTEIVFHVPTLMPTDLEHDPQCSNKKRHFGNDFVNIIYNDSGLLYRFDTFKSAFNYVNIVITPEAVPMTFTVQAPLNRNAPDAELGAATGQDAQLKKKHYFKVQVICGPSFPKVSPATIPKMVSAASLPGYVRQLALNASVFSLVWSNRGGSEHISSWRSRLREIRKLRERYANTGTSANVGYPGMGTAEDRGGARSYYEGDDWRGTLAMGGLAEDGQFLMSLDFTRWT